MATRTRKQTIPATPFVETVHPEAEFTMSGVDWAHIIKGEASWKRWGIAVVASLLASVAIGQVGGVVLGYLMVGAIVLTGSAFITTLIYVLGILLAMYAGYRASMFIYINVIDKTVDAKCSAAWGWATSLFNSKKVCAS
jgi:hypothetical protein